MKRLGKGLGELIDADAGTQPASGLVMLRTDQVRPGRFQPRQMIAEESLEELKASIKRSGIIEPILVRPLAHGTFELVAGERRFRATQALGIGELPAIIRTLSDREALEFSLVENVQRENLNPLEEARGYQRLLEEFGYTQEDIAQALGKDRATVANLLRVLALPEEVREGLGSGKISLGHAKALLAVAERTRQLALYHKAAKEGLSVRQVEQLAGAWTPARRARRRHDPQVAELEEKLRGALGTKVSLVPRKKGGRVIVEYFSAEDLARILGVLGVAA